MTHIAEHPGVFIRVRILRPRKLTVAEGARVLGVSRPALSNVITGRASLSPEMALKIEQAWGVSMETLLARQLAYDIAQCRAAARKESQ